MDIRLAIGEYIEQNKALVGQDDGFNVVDDQIFEWGFKKLPRPDASLLEQLYQQALARESVAKTSISSKISIREKLKGLDKSKLTTVASCRDAIADIVDLLK